MKTYFKSDAQRVNLYMDENVELQKQMHVQADEIPKLEQLMGEVKPQYSTNDSTENDSKKYFRQQLSIQHKDMLHLNNELELQQKRLEKDKLNNVNYDVESLSSQDILRDKVKEIEKKYAELKHNIMNFLSNGL